MIKQAIVGHFSQASNQTLADRYFLGHHGPDIVRVAGPWLRRFETYLAHTPPSEAVERFGAMGGRYTEYWYTSIAEWLTRPALYAATPGPEVFLGKDWHMDAKSHAAVMVPGTPTEQFVDLPINPHKTTILRWICIIAYPKNVPIEEADKWFVDVHSQETRQQPGLIRYVSFRNIPDEAAAPPDPPKGMDLEAMPHWIRVSELWYKDFAAWRKAVIETPPKYTPPPWGGEYPFVEIASNFVDLKPDADLLKGNYQVP